MRYDISINGNGYFDHVIKEDGTLVSGPASSSPVLITHINVIAPGANVTPPQYFALFTLITLLQKELSRPLVTGNLSWQEIVDGAKK